MILITADGRELDSPTIMLSEEPKRFSFKVRNMTIPEASEMFCLGNVLPLKTYEEFTEVASISRNASNGVMVTLIPPENDRRSK